MKEFSSAPKLLVGALLVFCIGVWSLVVAPYVYTDAPKGGVQGALVVVAAPQSPSLSKVAVLLDAYQDMPLQERTKTSGCRVNGALPEHACTPGSVFATAGTSTICVSGYTKTVRSVSDKLRKQLYAAYGIGYPVPTGSYELDHLIPLAIGGDNSAANLFPEAADPKPGFKEKDVVEVYLQEQVCAGHINLAAAQAAIADNWVPIFNAIEKSDVSRIRQKYTSWAN